MDQKPDAILKDIDRTRSSLTEKLELLEGQVRGSVETARSTVEDTIQTIKENVQHTVDGVKQTLSPTHQMQERPWITLGGTIAAGYVVGRWLAIRREQEAFPPHPGPNDYFPTGEAYNMKEYRPGEGNYPLESHPRYQKGWFSTLADQFQDEIKMVKGLAVGMVVDQVGKDLKRTLPQISEKIDQIISSVNEKIGGERPAPEKKQSSVA